MAFVHGKDVRVLVNEVAASGKLHSVNSQNARAMSEATVFGDEGEKFLPGLMNGSFSLEGRFEDNTLYQNFKDANGVDNDLLVSAAMTGFTVGNPVASSVGDLASHNLTSSVTDVVGFTVESTADEVVDMGVSLHDLTAETATADGTAVDNGASTGNGGVGVLHVTAASGTSPTADVTIQHSVDNVTFVDLVTFTQATGATSERIAVPGTVDQYLRATWTIGGTSPSFTFVVAFARR